MEVSKKSGKSLAYLFVVALMLVPGKMVAQDSTSHASLQGWEQRTLNFMLDRSHNYGGTNYNRGLFRYNTNLMSPEHEIDLLTYQYTLLDDYQWMSVDQGYRTSFGSLNATNFAIENKFKTTYDINENNALFINGNHEENLRTSRFLFRLGYQHKFGGNHYVGVKPTLSNHKSDLDVTAYYRYGTPGDGMVYVGFTKLDWFANVVQGLAEDSDNEYKQLYEETFEYEKSPNILNIRLESPQIQNFRAELRAGYQTFLQKRVSPAPDTLDSIDKEWAHYVGALLEYNHPWGLVGITYQRRFSKLRRQPAKQSDFKNDFTNKQFTNKGGFFATGTINKFNVQHWMWLERNVDRLTGKTVPKGLRPALPQGRTAFNYVEYRWKIKSRILYRQHSRGVRMGLEFHADYRLPQGDKDPKKGIRDFKYRLVYPTVRNRSDRLTYTVGYRVNKHFFFEGGISYDLDGDRQSGVGLTVSGDQTWFDGGFGRLSLQW